MGTYVGEIRFNGFFINFFPSYQVIDGKFEPLKEEELEEMLPGSRCMNINLISTSSSIPLTEIFQDGDDVLINFGFGDLQANRRVDGQRYPTAWKLDLAKLGILAISHMDDLGYYYLLRPEEVIGDWQQDQVLYINTTDVKEDINVMIPTEKPNTLIGPYVVRYDEEQDRYYVRLATRANMTSQKHIVHGHQYTDGLENHIIYLELTDVIREYVPTLGEKIVPYSYDCITPEALMENFCDLLASRSGSKALRLDANLGKQMVKIYQNSLITGPGGLSIEDAQKRADQLLSIIDTHVLFEQTLDRIGTLAGSLIYNLQDKSVYPMVIDALSKDETFLSNLNSFREFAKQEEKHKKELGELQSRKELLEAQVQELARLNPEKKIEEAKQQIEKLDEIKTQSEQKLQEIINHTNLAQSFEDLKRQSEFLASESQSKQQEIALLEERLKTLQQELETILERSSQKAIEMSFDTFIAAKLASENERLEQEKRNSTYLRAAKGLQSIPRSHLDREQLIALVVQAIQAKRPEYSENDILNFLICFSQGFLTLLCGPSGSGKTTICEIVAQSLGLMKPQELMRSNPELPYLLRYAQVGVEKGWNSHRDLIGYYNGLSQTFEKANPDFYDLLFVLDAESRMKNEESSKDVLPAFVLLDNANLSAMEYYWSDFLSLNEDEEICGVLNLGKNFQLQVPNTLHFMASIQSDHTSQPLSARLLDRAWVVSMPEVGSLRLDGNIDIFTPIQTLTKAQLDEAFGWPSNDLHMSENAEGIFNALLQAFQEAGRPVSIRSQKAIRSYVAAGSRLFQPTSSQPLSEIIALDYAVLQRLLPKINGSSSHYRAHLEAIRKLLEAFHLSMSLKKLEHIIAAGDGAMQYYQFFS